MEDLISIEEASKILNLSKSRVYVLCSQGKIPRYKRKGGNRLFFKKEDLHYLIMDKCLNDKETETKIEIKQEEYPTPASELAKRFKEEEEKHAIELLKSKGYKITKTVEV